MIVGSCSKLAYVEAGLPLSPIEVDALSPLSRVAIARLPESLDPSLRGRRKTDPGSRSWTRTSRRTAGVGPVIGC